MSALLDHKKLRKEMKEKDLKQEEFAEKLDISDRHLRNLRSKDTNVSSSLLKKLSEELQVPMDDLLTAGEERKWPGRYTGGFRWRSRCATAVPCMWRKSMCFPTAMARRPIRSARDAGERWSGNTWPFVAAADKCWTGGATSTPELFMYTERGAACC